MKQLKKLKKKHALWFSVVMVCRTMVERLVRSVGFVNSKIWRLMEWGHTIVRAWHPLDTRRFKLVHAWVLVECVSQSREERIRSLVYWLITLSETATRAVNHSKVLFIIFYFHTCGVSCGFSCGKTLGKFYTFETCKNG